MIHFSQYYQLIPLGDTEHLLYGRGCELRRCAKKKREEQCSAPWQDARGRLSEEMLYAQTPKWLAI